MTITQYLVPDTQNFLNNIKKALPENIDKNCFYMSSTLGV